MIGRVSGMIRSDGSDHNEEAFGSVYDNRVIRRMLPYLARQKHLAALAIASMLVYTVTFAAVPWIVKVAIDGLHPRRRLLRPHLAGRPLHG